HECAGLRGGRVRGASRRAPQTATTVRAAPRRDRGRATAHSSPGSAVRGHTVRRCDWTGRRERRRARLRSPLHSARRGWRAHGEHDTAAPARHRRRRGGSAPAGPDAAAGRGHVEPARQGARARRTALLPAAGGRRVRSGGPRAANGRAGGFRHGGVPDVSTGARWDRRRRIFQRRQHRRQPAAAAAGSAARRRAAESHDALRARDPARPQRHRGGHWCRPYRSHRTGEAGGGTGGHAAERRRRRDRTLGSRRSCREQGRSGRGSELDRALRRGSGAWLGFVRCSGRHGAGSVLLLLARNSDVESRCGLVASYCPPAVPCCILCPTMSDFRDSLAQGLAGRYSLQRELGQGGMAIVYLAHDLRHDREVALKVLRPEVSAAMGAERFLREIKLAAGLTHPHILPVFDSGEAGGMLFYVMPSMEGRSLRERLDRERKLSLSESLRITREVASALDYAHRHNVVHRDIKPENILLHEGAAMVADFGIGKALSGNGASLTQTGLSLGTPAYMSPEQASGELDTDGRSDLYSLGCVLYEMLAGEPPFTG